MRRITFIALVLALIAQTSAQVPVPVETELQKIERSVNDIRAFYPPPPQPVDCAMTPFAIASATAWAPDPCPQTGLQTRDAMYSRTITTPASNGGVACGPLDEARTESQTCTPPPTKVAGLIYEADLTYVGAFRGPVAPDQTRTLAYGGTGLQFWPAHNSLLVVGHDHYQLVAEMSIPTPSKATTLAALPRASYVQDFIDILQGKRLSVDGGTGNGVKVGTAVPVGNNLVVPVWTYYDAVPQPQTITHFVTGQDFLHLPPTTGAYQVGRGFQDFYSKDTTRIGGFVSGYMTPIPVEYQAQLGGTHLSGQGGMVSILGRTSSGPSATVFTPSELGLAAAATTTTTTTASGPRGGGQSDQRPPTTTTTTSTSTGYTIPGAAERATQLDAIEEDLAKGTIDATTASERRDRVWDEMYRRRRNVPTPQNTTGNAWLVMGYPTGAPLQFPTIGVWGQNGGIYNGTQGFRGMVFPDGTRSILFIGWGGTKFCYGAGTTDPNLDHQPHPAGGVYCYDPASLGKGTHGYPYRSLIFAYDVLDFIAVKEGRKKPWEVVPYATWSFAMPFQQKLDAAGLDIATYQVVGGTYDPATRRIFMTAYQTDGVAPIFHVFQLPPLTRR